MAAKGVDLNGVVEESTRRNIFRREIERAIGDGTGDFDADFMLEKARAFVCVKSRGRGVPGAGAPPRRPCLTASNRAC